MKEIFDEDCSFFLNFTNSLILLLRNDILHKKVRKIVFNLSKTIYLKFSAGEKLLPGNVIVCLHFNFFFLYFILLSEYESIHFPLQSFYNLGHNILRLFDVLPNFPLTISETSRDY